MKETQKRRNWETEEDFKRIREITITLVAGQISKGELNPEDETALKKAVQQAARDARQAYYAALEFMSG